MPGLDGLTSGARIPQPPGDREHPDHRAVDQGRPADQERGVRGRGQRLSGQAAGQHRAGGADPLSLALLHDPVAAGCGLSCAAGQPAAVARHQPGAATADELRRPHRAVEPSAFRRIPGAGMAPRPA